MIHHCVLCWMVSERAITKTGSPPDSSLASDYQACKGMKLLLAMTHCTQCTQCTFFSILYIIESMMSTIAYPLVSTQ